MMGEELLIFGESKRKAIWEYLTDIVIYKIKEISLSELSKKLKLDRNGGSFKQIKDFLIESHFAKVSHTENRKKYIIINVRKLEEYLRGLRTSKKMIEFIHKTSWFAETGK